MIEVAGIVLSAWIGGLIVSLVGGWIACGIFMFFLRKWRGITKRTDVKTVPPALTGLVERVFFTFLVSVTPAGAGPTMIAWIALKMASNWNRDNNDVNGRFHRIAALLTGLLSMLFALFGGLIVASGT